MIKKISRYLTVAALSFIGYGTSYAFGPSLSFEQIDANGDGMATKAELVEALAWRPVSADKVLGMLDTDGDGQISREEFDARSKKTNR